MKRLNLSWVLFLLIACSSPKSDPSNCPVADIRAGLENPKSLKLSDEIESVDYVPLEVTSDDASLIDGVANYAVTDKYIYVLPVKEQRIVLFDRQGHFASLKELAATTLQHGLLGTRSYQGFPVWGNMTGNDLVQVITSAELDYYKNIRSILIPEQLKNLGEESNPVFIFYKLKDS